MANLGIKIIGPAQSISCFGNFTREIAFTLLSMGENVQVVDTTYQHDFQVQLNADDLAKLNLLKSVANLPAPFVAIHINSPERITFVDNNAVANIAWTSSDILSLPLVSSMMLSNTLLKEIWIPSSQKMFFDSYDYLSKKTAVQNFGVNIDKFDPSLIESSRKSVSFRSDPDAFYFGFIGSLKYTTGFDLTLRAFFEEFSNEPKAKLVFKPFMGNLQPAQEKELISKIITDIKKDSKAELLYIPGSQSDDFMTVHHHAIDCLVSPARGKAWNNSVIKCMSAGIPTIVNAHAGNKSYTSKETNYVLSSSKNTNIMNLDWLMQNLLHQGGTWSEPNLDELKKAMRTAFNNRSDKEIPSKARARVEKLDWKNIAVEVLKNIRKFN
jgi:glycosyltransferase involved in cell wall biosynthesis